MTADYPDYSSAEEVVAQSDAIIIAQVQSFREDIPYPMDTGVDDPLLNPQAGLDPDEIDIDDLGVPVTITTVTVIESLRGEYPVGAEGEITQLGGVMQDTRYEESGTILLEDAVGDAFLLLLSDVEGTLELVSPSLGIQVLSDDGTNLEAVESTDGETYGRELGIDLQELELLLEEQDRPQ